ncbi:MAG TPA: TetR family transcriptional regulator [Galbitalea sp.]|jgi:AcrR family transcriptional regulator
MPTPTARSPRRDALDNRVALIEAARVVFARDPGASLDAIAVEAGLSRRAVYGHFASRDDLQRELVTMGAARIAAALEGIDHEDPVVRLALIAAGIWREVASMRVMALFAIRGNLQAHTVNALAPLRLKVFEAVREGIAAGSVRADIPAERLARLVEDAALAILAESNRSNLSAREGHTLVQLSVLGALGFGWREAEALISNTPELNGTD